MWNQAGLSVGQELAVTTEIEQLALPRPKGLSRFHLQA